MYIKAILVTGNASVSRLTRGILLDQNKRYMDCSMSRTAQAGIGRAVAWHHNTKVNRPLITRVLPLKLRFLLGQADIVLFILDMQGC